jgi:hypothetical protein
LAETDFRVRNLQKSQNVRTTPLEPTTGPSSKLFVCVCVFITAGPIIKLCAGGRGTVKDMCYVVRRAEACVD